MCDWTLEALRDLFGEGVLHALCLCCRENFFGAKVGVVAKVAAAKQCVGVGLLEWDVDWACSSVEKVALRCGCLQLNQVRGVRCAPAVKGGLVAICSGSIQKQG